MILGLAAGAALYPEGRRGPGGGGCPRPRTPARSGGPGRHALPIYLVHQTVLIPLIAAALAIAGREVSLDRSTGARPLRRRPRSPGRGPR